MQLRIVDHIGQIISIIHGRCRIIARQDSDLSQRMQRAIDSLGLLATNGARGEGLSACGGKRTVRLESAMASGREVIFGLRFAGVADYVHAATGSKNPRSGGGAPDSPRHTDGAVGHRGSRR